MLQINSQHGARKTTSSENIYLIVICSDTFTKNLLTLWFAVTLQQTVFIEVGMAT